MSTQFDVSLLLAQGLTVGGVEFERESFLDSLRKLMQIYTFDTTEVDGKLIAVPHGQSSVITIPEDDLGALDDPTKYEPRANEILHDERDIPRKVTLKYYDFLKDTQQATQEAKRIQAAYASSLSLAKRNTFSNEQVDIVSPCSDFATPIAKRADIILWEAWAGRFIYKFKLGPKYVRLDPGDVITVVYKGRSLVMRIIEADYGSGGAREITAVSQDSSVYSSAVTGASSGTGGGVGSMGSPPPPPPPPSTTYTIVPPSPLSETTNTNIHMVQVVATFAPSGLRTSYNPRDFTIPDPGSTPTRYYVTVYDPTFIGDSTGLTNLTAFCDPNPANVHLGQTGYVFMGTILCTTNLVGVVVTSGGSGNVAQAQGFYVNGSGGGGFSTQEDLVSYFTMLNRSSHHLAGSAANTPSNKFYSYLDTSIQAFAFVKAAAGWANDILLYDSLSAVNPSGIPMIYHLITELDDADHPDWGIPTSYKKNEDAHGYARSPGLPICPRFMTLGSSPYMVGPFASPNNYGRYVSCSKIDTKNKGNFFTVTHAPQTMNIDNRGSSVGNLGNIQVVVNERYSGLKQRERFYLGKDLGLVMWDAALLISGTQGPGGQYSIFNWSVHNQLVAGGGVSSSFGCGWGAGWP